MTTQIIVSNPSPHARSGLVVMPWQPVHKACGLAADEVAVFHDGKELDTQVDRIDRGDHARDELVFFLKDTVCDGTDDYAKACATLTIGRRMRRVAGPRADEKATGVKLVSEDEVFKVWINTATDRDGHGTWFGGAITSVEAGPIDLLDSSAYFRSAKPRKNKRLQLDRIRLYRSPQDQTAPWQDEFVFNQAWEVVGVSRGRVRALTTIRSKPFPYTWSEKGQPQQTITCAVYRTFAIYSNDYRIFETTCVRQLADGKATKEDLWFVPRYFMLMRLALAQPIKSFRYPSLPGWFSLSSRAYPYAGFAHATDSQAGPVWNPPLDYTDGDDDSEDDAYMWELSATRKAYAVHMFFVQTGLERVTDAAGKAWYDVAYRPLRGSLASGSSR
jgi:hypothetical protein